MIFHIFLWFSHGFPWFPVMIFPSTAHQLGLGRAPAPSTPNLPGHGAGPAIHTSLKLANMEHAADSAMIYVIYHDLPNKHGGFPIFSCKTMAWGEEVALEMRVNWGCMAPEIVVLLLIYRGLAPPYPAAYPHCALSWGSVSNFPTLWCNHT